MKFLVTAVEFDWDNEEGSTLTSFEKSDMIAETIGHVWEANDDDDLVEEVTAAYGWCINSIEYKHVLR